MEWYYYADRAVRPSHPDFHALDQCRAYVSSIVNSVWWLRRANPRWSFKLVNGGDDESAFISGITPRFTIRLPPWTRSRVVILHELAHALALALGRGDQGHSWRFRRCHTQLVHHYLGKGTARILRRAYLLGWLKNLLCKEEK